MAEDEKNLFPIMHIYDHYVFFQFSLCLKNNCHMLKKMQCLSHTPFSCQLLHLRFKRDKPKQQDGMQPIHREQNCFHLTILHSADTLWWTMCNISRLNNRDHQTIFNKASMNNRASLEKSQVYFGWKLQWQNQWQVNEHGRSAYPFLSNINLTRPMSWV